jgi:outer membrane protein TolC
MDKKLILMIMFLSAWLGGKGQLATLNLEQCIQAASATNPVFEKSKVIQSLGAVTGEKLGQNWLPTFKINGQLTWQNEVTQLNIDAPIPGFEVPQIPQTQYRVAGELTQTVFDGGLTRRTKALEKAKTQASTLQAETGQQDLTLQIQNLFFQVLLLDANKRSLDLVQEDLAKQLEKVRSLRENGMVTGAAIDRLQAEMLVVELKMDQLQRGKETVVNNLALLTSLDISINTGFTLPEPAPEADIRKEYAFFEAQKSIIDKQVDLLNASGIPLLQAFVLGGYGQPGFNFLDENPAFLFQAGVRLQWDISSFYTKQKDREILSLRQVQLDKEKRVFDLKQQNTANQLEQSLDDYAAALQSDQKIISLREKIKERAAAQLANGTLTTAEYILDLNEWSRAMLEKDLHQIQELQTIYSLRFYTSQ